MALVGHQEPQIGNENGYFVTLVSLTDEIFKETQCTILFLESRQTFEAAQQKWRPATRLPHTKKMFHSKNLSQIGASQDFNPKPWQALSRAGQSNDFTTPQQGV